MYTCASNSLPSVFVAQLPSLGLAAAAFPCTPSDQRKTQSLLMHALAYLHRCLSYLVHTLSVCSSLCCLLIWLALSWSSVPCCWSRPSFCWSCVSFCWSWVSFASTSACNLSLFSYNNEIISCNCVCICPDDRYLTFSVCISLCCLLIWAFFCWSCVASCRTWTLSP